MQSKVAKQLGITAGTLLNWEKNHSLPLPVHYPRITTYLGYCPYEVVLTFGQKLKLHRLYAGLTKSAMANLLGIDAGTLARWERNRTFPLKRHREALAVARILKETVPL